MYKDLKRLYNESITSFYNNLNSYIPIFIKNILDIFEEELVTHYSNSTSLSSPSNYIELFKEELNSFNFIKRSESSVALISLDIDNFNWDKLDVIKSALEGVHGGYLELTKEQSELLLASDKVPSIYKRIISSYPLLESKGILFRVVPVEVGTILENILINKFKITGKLNPFVFSNSPPIDLLESINHMLSKKFDDVCKEFANNLSENLK